MYVIAARASTSNLPALKLCGSHGSLTDKNRFFGSLQHSNDLSSRELFTIIIPKPTGTAHNYAVLEGVEAMASTESCLQSQVTIMSKDYCISATKFIVIGMDEGHLNISARKDTQAFEIRYYFTGKNQK